MDPSEEAALGGNHGNVICLVTNGTPENRTPVGIIIMCCNDVDIKDGEINENLTVWFDCGFTFYYSSMNTSIIPSPAVGGKETYSLSIYDIQNQFIGKTLKCIVI